VRQMVLDQDLKLHYVRHHLFQVHLLKVQVHLLEVQVHHHLQVRVQGHRVAVHQVRVDHLVHHLLLDHLVVAVQVHLEVLAVRQVAVVRVHRLLQGVHQVVAVVQVVDHHLQAVRVHHLLLDHLVHLLVQVIHATTV